MSIEIVHTEKSEKAYKLTFQKLPGMMFVIQANELRDACRKSLKNGSIGGLTLASDYFNDHDPIDVSTGETTTSDYFLGMAISVGYIWDRSVNLALTFELRDAADFYDESLESVQVNALLHRGRNNNDKWSIQMGMAQGTVEAKYDSQKHGCQLDVKLNTPEMSEWNPVGSSTPSGQP
jgi:hypothetical protein